MVAAWLRVAFWTKRRLPLPLSLVLSMVVSPIVMLVGVGGGAAAVVNDQENGAVIG